MPEDRPSRIAFLRGRIEAVRRSPNPATFDVPFRGRPITLPRIEVRADFPLYRIQSGRTHRAQAAYLDRHTELPPDFFNDPEDPQVQRAQHEILLELIDEEGLRQDLVEREQWNPLVLTHDGFVVDGNRRLCALRDEHSEYVRVVVLPEDAESPEIFETEIELQMARETRAEYNWVDQALHIRYGIEQLGERVEVLAERMRMDVDEIRASIAELAMVDMYLDWLGSPGKYHLVPAARGGTTQQAFRELTQRLSTQAAQRLSREEHQAIRETCFAVILSDGGYSDVRRVITNLTRSPQEFVRRVIEDLPDDLRREIETEGTSESLARTREERSDQDDLLAQLAQSEPRTGSAAAQGILLVVRDPTRARRAGQSVIRVAEDLAAEDREAQRLALPLQRVQRALREIDGVDLRSDTQNLDEVARTLAELIAEAERLMNEINRIRSEQRDA